MLVYSLSSNPSFDPNAVWMPLNFIQQWVRVDESEATMLQFLLLGAMKRAENWCKQPLFERRCKVTLDGFANGFFPGFIVSDVQATYIRYGVADPFPLVEGDFRLIDNELIFAPSLFTGGRVTAVNVELTMGYKPGEVPEDLLLALALDINYNYDNRADAVFQLPTRSHSYLAGYCRVTC